jgi:glucokinase
MFSGKKGGETKPVD